MYTIKKKIKEYTNIDFELIADKERLVFFDIETTGLSSAQASLYLIGLLSYERGSWQLIQYFAENMFDEEELILSFSNFLKNKTQKDGKLYLINYNGDNFDIPFLNSCANQYKIKLNLDMCYSFDFLKKTRSLKKMLNLSDCKLKTVEKFLGIYREDTFNGGELIELYKEFCRLHDKESDRKNTQELNELGEKTESILKVLLLHNEEDIIDMPALIQLLSYESLMNGEFEILSAEVSDGILDVNLRLDHSLPKELYFEERPYVISISQNASTDFNFTIELKEAELKYFFPDYKNYYYLTVEDYAVHKSVGEFVDRKVRKQATKKTAFIRKKGLFIEQPEEIYSPVFSEEYNSKKLYALFSPQIPKDHKKLKSYILLVLKKVL